MGWKVLLEQTCWDPRLSGVVDFGVAAAESGGALFTIWGESFGSLAG